MERVDRTVREELGRFAPVEGSTAAIVRAWPTAVGETVARNAWPARLARDGVLLVHTSSSTWAFELGRMAAEILEQLRAAVGEGTPHVLRFVPGPVPRSAAEQPDRRASAPLEVAPEDTATAAEIAAGIGDEDLRAIVARAAAASLAGARRRAASDRAF